MRFSPDPTRTPTPVQRKTLPPSKDINLRGSLSKLQEKKRCSRFWFYAALSNFSFPSKPNMPPKDVTDLLQVRKSNVLTGKDMRLITYIGVSSQANKYQEPPNPSNPETRSAQGKGPHPRSYESPDPRAPWTKSNNTSSQPTLASPEPDSTIVGRADQSPF